MSDQIVRCVSCEGYGWFEDEEDGQAVDCDWCAGVGYVYRDAQQVDHKIPPEHYGRVADELERLETARLAELGYTGSAKRPWEQSVREGTKGGQPPPAADEETDSDETV